MLKQSGSRNHRYKEFKVKHAVQICALLALCIWLLNQARSNTDKKGTDIGILTSEKLGRKELNPRVHGIQNGVDDEVEDSKPEETEEEIEDLIDEEDREQENQIEDLSLMTINEGDESLKEEKHKSEDASTVLVKDNFDTTETAA